MCRIIMEYCLRLRSIYRTIQIFLVINYLLWLMYLICPERYFPLKNSQKHTKIVYDCAHEKRVVMAFCLKQRDNVIKK